MNFDPLKDSEFEKFRKLIYELAGINLSNEKKALVSGRLQKRLRHYQISSYGKYYDIVTGGDDLEKQILVNLLTTNETYFYREPDHFEFVKNHILQNWPEKRSFRVWSAASSTGEEAYTLAFYLAKFLRGENWEIVGTDINEEVVAKSGRGQYPMQRAENIPKEVLRNYCLKGVRSQEGTFLIRKFLRDKVNFYKMNLLEPNRDLGKFNLVFLRNVMIYFNRETRIKVVENILPYMYDDAYLIVGHAESLYGISGQIKAFRPTIYQKTQILEQI